VQVPPVARVWLEGAPRPSVTGKDVILGLCGFFRGDEVLNHAVEFAGPGVAHLSVEERMTIANMSTEWGALAGVFPVDHVTASWLQARAATLRGRWGAAEPPPRVLESEQAAREAAAGVRVSPDPDAAYAKELRLDLSSLCPYVVGPNEIKRLEAVHEVERRRVAVHKAYIVSCVNSRVSDLAAAAEVLRGRKVAPGVELYVAAASSQVQQESTARGDWQALMDAGGWVGWRVGGVGDQAYPGSLWCPVLMSYSFILCSHQQLQGPWPCRRAAGRAWGWGGGCSSRGRWPSRRPTATSGAAWAPGTRRPTWRRLLWWRSPRPWGTSPGRTRGPLR
jgi:homoaconitase/3-isopropylmalate dehydratase large subunit